MTDSDAAARPISRLVVAARQNRVSPSRRDMSALNPDMSTATIGAPTKTPPSPISAASGTAWTPPLTSGRWCSGRGFGKGIGPARHGGCRRAGGRRGRCRIVQIPVVRNGRHSPLRHETVHHRIGMIRAAGTARPLRADRAGRSKQVVDADGRQKPGVPGRIRTQPCRAGRGGRPQKVIEEIHLLGQRVRPQPGMAASRGAGRAGLVQRRQQPRVLAQRRQFQRIGQIGPGKADNQLIGADQQDVAIVQRRRRAAKGYLAVVEEGAVRRQVQHDHPAAMILDHAMALGNHQVRIGQDHVVLRRAPQRQAAPAHADQIRTPRNPAGRLKSQGQGHLSSVFLIRRSAL